MSNLKWTRSGNDFGTNGIERFKLALNFEVEWNSCDYCSFQESRYLYIFFNILTWQVQNRWSWSNLEKWQLTLVEALYCTDIFCLKSEHISNKCSEEDYSSTSVHLRFENVCSFKMQNLQCSTKENEILVENSLRRLKRVFRCYILCETKEDYKEGCLMVWGNYVSLQLCCWAIL